MKSLAVRLTLLGLFVVATGVTAYLFWMGESRGRLEIEAARAFDARTISATRDVLELKAAQQSYVAPGQGNEFWAAKVTTALAGLRETLAGLRTEASSLQAQSAIDAASSSLQDFEQMDRRAREFAHNGQNLPASDLIFSSGLDIANAAVASLDQARTAELRQRDDTARALHRRQVFAAGAAAAAALLVIVLLVPRAAADGVMAPAGIGMNLSRTAPVRNSIATTELGSALDESWSSARRVEAAPAAKAAPAPPAHPPLDIAGIAALCCDLAKVVDTRALPSILERAAGVLDAPGIVLWIADPDGRELNPIITHGYSPQVVSRLGTILRDAENATASAFRTSLVQTVKTDAVSNGAIAAPLVTPAGCVGVMAAEVRREGERDPGKLAAATIVAAQLATLVGPPSTRAHAKAEAAGA